MSITIYEYIIWLDISMYVMNFMHILYSQNKFTDIKFGLFFSKNILFDE
jgi:hypothetical protein